GNPSLNHRYRKGFYSLFKTLQQNRMSDIDRQIFNTAKKEFTLVQENGRPLFEYFRVEKVKAKKGNRISSFKIYFKEHRLNISMHNWLNEDE
ncbi:hypothetical protein ABHA26_13470, partial [Enterococcus faecium]|nr:hypothetical protein [Enterococcus faecium]MDB7492804.1 hypothetical protein [Enterococcus faecium]MDB7495370.1 hypothetical protein [Enterococcus faecium]MDB7497948.1 hypothetical protein [Enterococcus faecium]MDB7500497.1 hypothetical protein [Enterococcus faecium]